MYTLVALLGWQALAQIFSRTIADGVGARDFWGGGSGPVPIEFWGSERDGQLVDFFCTRYQHRRLVVACRARSQMMAMLERRHFRCFATTDHDYLLLERS